MKTAIYIEDGTLQLVITPETDHEKASLRLFQDQDVDAKIFTGSFYDCRGGWVRQAYYSHQAMYGNKKDDRSLILRVKTEKPVISE